VSPWGSSLPSLALSFVDHFVNTATTKIAPGAGTVALK